MRTRTDRDFSILSERSVGTLRAGGDGRWRNTLSRFSNQLYQPEPEGWVQILGWQEYGGWSATGQGVERKDPGPTVGSVGPGGKGRDSSERDRHQRGHNRASGKPRHRGHGPGERPCGPFQGSGSVAGMTFEKGLHSERRCESGSPYEIDPDCIPSGIRYARTLLSRPASFRSIRFGNSLHPVWSKRCPARCCANGHEGNKP